jgi:hypothetical protein
MPQEQLECYEQLTLGISGWLHEKPYAPARKDLLEVCSDELMSMHTVNLGDLNARRTINFEHGPKKIAIHNALYDLTLDREFLRAIVREKLAPKKSDDDNESQGAADLQEYEIVSLVPRITRPVHRSDTLRLFEDVVDGIYVRGMR